jgi:XapX domain-containing protein
MTLTPSESRMKIYLISLATGVLVGVVYAVMNVRSPAPPVVALVGLLGILIGESLPPLVKDAISGRTNSSFPSVTPANPVQAPGSSSRLPPVPGAPEKGAPPRPD